MLVTCRTCSAMYDWVPTKGARLASQRCPVCGGVLSRTARPSGPLIACGVCGRRRGEDKIARPVIEFRADPVFGGDVLPAGTPCCFRHTLTTPDLTRRLTFQEKYGSPP